MKEHALELAEAGWNVHPCHASGTRAKSPLTEHGHLDATRNPDIIATWWERWPDAMIGGPVPEHLIVLDPDPRNGGTLQALEEIAGPLPQTLTAWSGRDDGGCHLYFLRPYGELTSTRLPKGIDLKANGYCILPPSIHPATGKPYRWEIHEPVALPRRLRDLLRPLRVLRPYAVTGGKTNTAGLVRVVASAREGERNRALFWAASRAAENGIIDSLTPELVKSAIAAGLLEREALRVIASASRRTTVQR